MINLLNAIASTTYASSSATAPLKAVTRVVIFSSLALLMACGGDDERTAGKSPFTFASSSIKEGFVGSVAADEPRAALVGRDILVHGGNAVDAASATALALSVTLPSRASLGAGGACLLTRSGDEEAPAHAFLFLPVGGSNTRLEEGAPVDRPAAVPMMVRGMYLMQEKYGTVDYPHIVFPAHELASHGVTVSNALAEDLAHVKGALLADSWARKVFSRPDGGVLVAGDSLVQPHLAAMLEQISTAGVGDMYNGALAHIFVAGAQSAGGGLISSDLRQALPSEVPALTLQPNEETNLYFLPPPADGGLGMGMAYRALSANEANAPVLAEGTIAAWRKAHPGTKSEMFRTLIEEAQGLLNAGQGASGHLPNLPASTSFVVVDNTGQAVTCALTMNNLFGTGRIAGTTGVVLAASPALHPTPMLTGGIGVVENRFKAVVGASGQNDAAYAGAQALYKAMSGHPSSTTSTKEGRINVIGCEEGLPGSGEECKALTDEKGYGLAVTTGRDAKD